MQQPIERIVATDPVRTPPTWAVLQRRLFDVLEQSWPIYADRYCAEDGTLPYAGVLQSRDGADDFYEAFVNWPVLYQLGGSDDLLQAAKLGWHAVTRQLTELGYLQDEFERGYDWFHLGESLIFFYALCAADPDDQAFAERAHRFAELYLPDSPTGNYDAEHRMITAPHSGAAGPRWGTNDEWLDYGTHLAVMQGFGLPLHGLPGIDSWDDLADPAKSRQMGAEMARRLGAGDVAVNLAATSLITNAWLYDHQDRYATWVQDYLAGWAERAQDNGGLIPDNVGTNGVVGELHGGRWWGGNYGWHWPHGLYSIGPSVCIAAVNAAMITGDDQALQLARETLDRVYQYGYVASVDQTEMSIRDRWQAELGADTARPTLLIPNRYGPDGWFDFQPPQLGLPTWLWQTGFADQDADRLQWLRQASGYDWRTVRDFRNKEDAGHEAPWLAYLAGDNPDYPEQILQVALSQVQRRVDLIAQDPVDVPTNVHHWQRHNPVLTEALLQLTTGTPQLIYTGGLLPTRLQHLDLDHGRPGLPPDVAALVDHSSAERIGLQLINLSPTATRRLAVQAGSLGTDRIDAVGWTVDTGSYPGSPVGYSTPEPEHRSERAPVGANRIEVELPPGRQVRLTLELTRNAYPAGHRRPITTR